ncbi:Rid family hydrolase [Mycolicibacterium sp. XJ1819]
MKTFDPDFMRGLVPGFVFGASQNGIAFLAGQVGLDRDLKVVEGRRAQTEQALRNIRETLDAGGLEISSLAQMMIFYKAQDDLVLTEAIEEFVALKDEILPGSTPAGFVCSVHGLLYPELLVEVQAVAFTRQ